MRFNLSMINDRHRLATLLMALTICVGHFSFQAKEPQVYDIDAAKAYCDSAPLEDPEGIWLYPDDGVTVLITKRQALSPSSLPCFNIRVVDTSDVRLRPGDVIGSLTATPERKKFEISLFTERSAAGFLKPKTIVATLNTDGDAILMGKEKSKFNLRFSLNPSTLLPQLWRIVRINTSPVGTSSQNSTPAIGMVKIYPSYDGNGSSRRKPRYL